MAKSIMILKIEFFPLQNYLFDFFSTWTLGPFWIFFNFFRLTLIFNVQQNGKKKMFRGVIVKRSTKIIVDIVVKINSLIFLHTFEFSREKSILIFSPATWCKSKNELATVKVEVSSFKMKPGFFYKVITLNYRQFFIVKVVTDTMTSPYD